VLRDETPYPFVVQTEQHKLSSSASAGLRDAERRASARNERDRCSQDLQRRPSHDRGAERHVFDYVIGCDGGRSAVRNASMSNSKATPGPIGFLVLTSLFDFQAALAAAAQLHLRSGGVDQPLQGHGDDLMDAGARVSGPGERNDDEAFSRDSVPGAAEIAQGSSDGARRAPEHLSRATSAWRNPSARAGLFLAGDAAHVITGRGSRLNCASTTRWSSPTRCHRSSIGRQARNCSIATSVAGADQRRVRAAANRREQKRLEERDPKVLRTISTSCAARRRSPPPQAIPHAHFADRKRAPGREIVDRRSTGFRGGRCSSRAPACAPWYREAQHPRLSFGHQPIVAYLVDPSPTPAVFRPVTHSAG